MTQSYALATLFQESISSNLPSQRNQQGQWKEVDQRLLDHWYVISGQWGKQTYYRPAKG